MLSLMRRKMPLSLRWWSSSALLFTLTAAVFAADEVVDLPAFVVDGSDARHTVPVRWLYAELPGMRIVSCCSQAVTDRWLWELRDQTRLYGWLLPAEIKPAVGGPLVVILDDRPSTSLRLMLNEQQARLRASGSERAIVVGAGIADWDFAVLFRQQGRGSPATDAASLVADACGASFTRQAGWAHVRQVLSLSRLNITAVGDGVDVYQPAAVLTERKLGLRSVASLFGPIDPSDEPDRKTTASAEETARWFGRWALFSENGSHANEFWKFARATIAQPHLDDKTAQHYFGMSLEELDLHVSRFRQRGESTLGLHLRLPSVPGTFLVPTREATDGEVAEAVAEWCLLTSRQSPNLHLPLRDAARRAIGRAQHAGQPTAPQVFAIAGLVELSDGNVEDARTLLESVATSADLNMGARFELARLRFAEATSHLGASGRTFEPAQTTSILTLLDPFLWQPPGNSDPLELILQTWIHSEKKPSASEIKSLTSLVVLFPGDEQLLLETADFCSQLGLNDEASVVATVGFANATSQESREKFASWRGK
jgi:hypothetical protein